MSQSTTVESRAEHPLATVPHEVRDAVALFLDRRVMGSDALPGPTEVECRWIGFARRVCAAKLRLWGLHRVVDDATLLASELVTNAIQHSKGEKVTVRILISLHTVVIEVEDGSVGRAAVAARGHWSESGRGMVIVAAVAQSWGVSADGTTTWCELAVPPLQRRAR
ncbi:ATP-binding protein [Streptomyces sp. NPDC006798]|uniref:ATP-binding protein n=1 Tax=Streptomyces sp. NPDC006798 TaxID=3155462 RepID=UPI0033F24927